MKIDPVDAAVAITLFKQAVHSLTKAAEALEPCSLARTILDSRDRVEREASHLNEILGYPLRPKEPQPRAKTRRRSA